MNEDKSENISETEINGLEFTPASMVTFLLQNGYTVDQIEGRIAAGSGFVQNCLADSKSIDGTPDGEIGRLKDLYLREEVKSLLRHSPFMGTQKAATTIGISRKEYEFIYNALIRAGELKYTRETPDWGDASSKKVPLRKHIVK